MRAEAAGERRRLFSGFFLFARQMFDFFVNDVKRPAFHFNENFGDIFADDAQGKKLHAAEACNEGDG